METASFLIVAIIGLAILGIMVLPMRKAWNADGSHDELRDSEARKLEERIRHQDPLMAVLDDEREDGP